MTQDVINAVKEAKEQSKPRNFTESVDIIINIRDLDVKEPENRFNEEVTLPNGRGKDVKIGVIADGELIVQAKDAGLSLVIRALDGLSGNSSSQTCGIGHQSHATLPSQSPCD